MIKVCIFNKSNDVSRFNMFKKFFQCQLQYISDMLHWNRCSLSKCDRDENGSIFAFLGGITDGVINDGYCSVYYRCVVCSSVTLVHSAKAVGKEWDDIWQEHSLARSTVELDSSCLNYLLPDKRNSSVTGRLPHTKTYEPLPTRTNKFWKPFIPYCLEHFD